ncbi:MAG: hypothetical protein R3F62_08075 [Planctomycetota bacterium]
MGLRVSVRRPGAGDPRVGQGRLRGVVGGGGVQLGEERQRRVEARGVSREGAAGVLDERAARRGVGARGRAEGGSDRRGVARGEGARELVQRTRGRRRGPRAQESSV